MPPRVSQKTTRLDWNRFAPQGETVAHVIYHHLTPGMCQSSHCHDFAEVFWCDRGSCEHTINGTGVPFEEGRLVFLKPSDVHELRADPVAGCGYYLVSFPRDVYRYLVARYTEETRFLRRPDAHSRCMLLTPLQRKRFAAAFQELLGESQNRLMLDRFLINLLYDLRALRLDPFSRCPGWLRESLRQLQEPEALREGIQALARHSGRSREHIARVMKATSGYSPSRAVCRLRVEHAAALLLQTSRPIIDIAFEVGFSGLGHFYQRFNETYRMPPRRYRECHQRVFAGDD